MKVVIIVMIVIVIVIGSDKNKNNNDTFDNNNNNNYAKLICFETRCQNHFPFIKSLLQSSGRTKATRYFRHNL